MPRLHVNVDHVATLRQARGVREPDPIAAAVQCELAGAEGITAHLREDRRHIQDRDVFLLRETVQTTFNLEMALTDEMLAIALEVKPDEVCFVPEMREELTTEGGLDAETHLDALTKFTEEFKAADILVSVFVDPRPEMLEAAARSGADFVELHTGAWANTQGAEAENERKRLETSARFAHDLGLRVNAGHGLNYRNVRPIASLPHVEELNIGHALIAHAVMVGMDQAVREMLDRILSADPADA